ncbi:hypothetical protein IKR20_09110 [bacterium]|nr:hypothetical protein [bacterium]
MTKIPITENDILEGNISNVAKVFDTLSQQPRQAECEGTVTLDFVSMTFYTMAQKFSQPEYRSWFKKLDRECLNMPFYLSDESMLPYLMGNIEFSIDSSRKMTFNAESAREFIRGKKNSLASFCLGNNIDPKKSMARLLTNIQTPAEASPNPPVNSETADSESPRSSMAKFFSKYPYSAKTILKDGEMKIQLTIFLENMPGGASILGIYFVNRNVPQPYFCVVCGNDEVVRDFNCVLLSSENDFTACLAKRNEVTCNFCVKDELDNMVAFSQEYKYVKQTTEQDAKTQIELLKQNVAQKKAADTGASRQTETSAPQQEISEAMLGFAPEELQEPQDKPESMMEEQNAEPLQEPAKPVSEPEKSGGKTAEAPVVPADARIAKLEERISELEKKVKKLTESNSLYLNELTRIQKKLDDITVKQFLKLLYQKIVR